MIFLSRNSNIQLTKKMRHFLEFFITVSKSKLSNYPLVFSKGEENDYCHYILLRMITGRVSDDSCLLETLYEKSCNDAIHLYLYSTGGITVIDPFSRGFSLLFSCQKILMKCMQLPLFAIFALTKHPNMNCLKISHMGQFIVSSANPNFLVQLSNRHFDSNLSVL